MKKLKPFIILFIIFVLSGCAVKEETVINDNGKVNQKVSFMVDASKMSEEDFRMYSKNVLNNYNKALNARNYKSKLVYDGSNSRVEVTNTFDNICQYFNNTVFSQYVYKRVSCTETEYYYEIKNLTEHIDYCYDCTTWPELEDVKYSITLPVEADFNDADYVNGNTYTWVFDKNTGKDKSLSIRISKTLMESNVKKVKRKAVTKKIFKKVSYVAIAFGVVAVGLIIINNLYKKYKNNKLTY